MPIVSEEGFWGQISDYRRGYTVPGFTLTNDFNLWPGDYSIHVGLARVSAYDAAIGIVEYSKGTDLITFKDETEWATAVYEKLGHYTVGMHVLAGTMRGWWYVQAWKP